ncbi:MAG: phospho-sugar mutase, partial [Erysipelotrichaceae bacterium]|nr:phospho-sugar mutase [Erysipelotrichaceae bacterium]
MNKYTVIKVTQGFANYLKSKANFDSNKGVAISYDNRNKSYEFAIYSSLVLNGNGIKTYVFKNLRPTPMLSFAVRAKNCIGGIMITASHNPREYNGYKVYGEDGAQLVSPKDEELISYVSKVKDFSEIKILTEEEAINKGFLNFIDQEMDNEYIEKVISRVVNKDINKDIKIVYTPLHGTGTVPVELALKKAGYKEFNIVEEQKVADSNFTTAPYPNPEDKSVFSSGLKIAKKIAADVVLATDPDADRVGAYVKHRDDYVYFTGNMIGSILIEYILKLREEQGKDNSKGYIISTIVSTNMAKKIVNSYGANYLNVLTGFKYIAEKIKSFEHTDNEFLFGFEESIGYLSTDFVRDKDAISTAVLICEVI